MTNQLREYIELRLTEFDQISEERKPILQSLADYVIDHQRNHETTKAVFICIHNSRRSHLSQSWFAAAMSYFEIGDIESYSGGTEVTRIHPNAVATLNRAGFGITTDNEDEDNPRYMAQIGDATFLELYSKLYEDEDNPQSSFAAVMVCTTADGNCPFVQGCDKRIVLPFTDPKEFDGTEKEAEGYDERCAQVAREMLWVANETNKALL